MQLWLGIDVASRAAHQASLADESGRFLWSGHRRTKSLARLDALLELLGPGWLEAFRADLANKTPLRFLAAAEETLALREDAFDFDQLAEDIAVEARLALTLTDEVAALGERIAVLFGEADPEAILTSAPSIGPATGPQILARLGDPNRFRSLAGVRSFSGLVPSLNASGVSGRHGRPTRRGDAALREAIFIAADHARRIDPTLAARYQRLMVSAGKRHNSALRHIATTLLTRVVACWRRGERYVIRDCDGRPVSVAEGRSIVAERYSVPAEVRRAAPGPACRHAQADGPPRSGVAERSGADPSAAYATTPRRGLTSVWNSLAQSSPGGYSTSGPTSSASRWTLISRGLAKGVRSLCSALNPNRQLLADPLMRGTLTAGVDFLQSPSTSLTVTGPYPSGEACSRLFWPILLGRPLLARSLLLAIRISRPNR